MVAVVQCAALIAPYVPIASNVSPEGGGELSRRLVPHPPGC